MNYYHFFRNMQCEELCEEAVEVLKEVWKLECPLMHLIGQHLSYLSCMLLSCWQSIIWVCGVAES